MAVSEQGYDQQVAPGGVATAPNQASPDAFGAQVGGALSELGDTIHKLHADQELTAFSASFAKLRAQNDEAALDLQKTLPADGSGYHATVTQTLAQQRDQLLGSIRDPRVREHASAQFDDYAAEQDSRAYAWQAGQSVANTLTSAAVAKDTMANRVQSGDPHAYADESGQWEAYVQGLTGIGQEARDKLSRAGHEALSVAQLDKMIDGGQIEPAKALIKSGAFDGVMSPEQLEHQRDRIDIEQRRQQAQAEHQAALAKAQVGQQRELLEARLSAGDTPTDAELASAASASASVGDPVGAFKLNVARAQSGVNRATQPWLPDQYTQAIAGLVAKGDKRTAAENVTLDQLQKIAPQRIDAFNKDPGSWAALNGMPRPAFDLTDQNSIAATRTWRASVLKASGRAPGLLPDGQARDMAQLAASSPAGQLKVANQLAGLGGTDAVTAARQVAPGDAMLARLTMLPGEDRAAAVNGAAARKAHPQLIDGLQPTSDAHTAFDGYVGGALALMPQQDVGSAFEATRNIFADGAVKAGQTIAGANDDAKIEDAAFRSLGGSTDKAGRRIGGIGTWNGAKVLLPATVRQDQFDRALTSLNWIANNPRAPVWSTGVTMKPGELQHFTPVARPNGQYEFHNARGEIVHDRAGGIWTLDLDTLARRVP